MADTRYIPKLSLFAAKPGDPSLISIPAVPTQVGIGDLNKSNFMLFSAEQIVTIIKKTEKLKSGEKMSKSELGLRFGVEKYGQDLYAIYEGGEKSLGEGAFGKVKLAQKLTGMSAGQWFAIKIQKLSDEEEKKQEQITQIMTEHEVLMELQHSPRIDIQSPRKPSTPRIDMIQAQDTQSPRSSSPKRSGSPATPQIDMSQTQDTQSPSSSSPKPSGSTARSGSPLGKSHDSPPQDTQSPRSSSPLLVRRSSSKKIDLYPFIMTLAKGMNFEKLLDQESVYGTAVPPALRMQFMLDLFRAEERLIMAKKVHRDIKSGNAMVDVIGQNASQIDFGNVGYLDADGNCKDAKIIGTYPFYAPELRDEYLQFLNGDGYVGKYVFNEKTEVFALGVMLAEVFNFYNGSSVPTIPNDDGSVTADIDFNKMGNNTYIITDTMSDEYVHNSTINTSQNPEDAKALLGLCHKMTAMDPKQRCTLREAIVALERIFKDYCARPETEHTQIKQKVGVIDYSDFINGEAEQKAELSDLLVGYNEIWFIDTGKQQHEQLEYVRTKNALEQAGFFVGDKVALNTDRAVAVKKLEGYLNNRKIKAVCDFIEMPKPEPKSTPGGGPA